MEAHCGARRSYSCDPALLQAVPLGCAREDGSFVVCAAGCVRVAWPAAPKWPARAVGRAPAAHCTVCYTDHAVCVRVFDDDVFELCAGCMCVSLCFPTCMSASVGSGAVLGRPVQLRGLWFGPHGP